MSDWVSFSEIKKRVTLEQVLHCYRINWLRRSGMHQYRGRCPIHQGEGTEAFQANLERGVFHCFACGAGGNVLDFIVAMEGCSIREAALWLRGLDGDGRLRSRGVAGSETKRRELVTKKREVNPPLGFTLDVDCRHPYLARRGMDAETASHFGVGYCGVGLMGGRIAIPIHDSHGDLVAYCGRALDGAAPRYRFPSGFQKSQVLFNYHRARAFGGRSLILVEGFFDCMHVHQAGYRCVAALMGARLSAAQKTLLADEFPRIVLLLDGDQTGRAATAQIARDLRSACSVTELLVPEGTQPDQMEADQIRQILTRGERRQEIGAN